MSKWEKVRLGDISSVITKGTTPTTLGYEFQDEGINFIKIENITENGCFVLDKIEHISKECNEKLKRSQLRDKDILFSIAGAIGRTAIVNKNILPANTNQALSIIRLNDERVLHKYVVKALVSQSTIRQFERQKQGVAQLNISLKNVSELLIPLPSIDEQKHIVFILDRVNHLINLCNNTLEKLDTLVKSRFVEMFGDPVENPFNWKMCTFKDICTVRQGLQIPISKRLLDKEDNCYKYITVAYLHGVKETEYIKSPKRSVICNEDDILMTRTGNTGMVISGVKGVFHNNFFLIDYNKELFNKEFLIKYLNLDIIQAEIIKRAGTSTIPDLNHGDFYKIYIYLPSIEIQNHFADFVAQVDKQKETVKKSLEKLETLKKSLMQEYFG